MGYIHFFHERRGAFGIWWWTMRKKRLQRGAQVKLFIVLTLSATTIKKLFSVLQLLRRNFKNKSDFFKHDFSFKLIKPDSVPVELH